MHTLKKNRIARFAVLLLVLTLMTSCFVGGTFAKYTSTAVATDVATVAKWDIKVTGTGAAQTISTATPPAITFGLFDTAKGVNGTSDDPNVVDGTIAPGSGGQFNFVIENDSEVAAKYTVAFEATNTGGIPIEYSNNGGSTWTTDITTLTLTGDLAINSAAATTSTVQWRWAFTGDQSVNFVAGKTYEQTDAKDTAFGIKGTLDTLTIEATITVEQVD